MMEKSVLNQYCKIQETLDSSFTVEGCYAMFKEGKGNTCLVIDADKQLVIVCYND